MALRIAVPTTSVIVQHYRDSNMVVVLRVKDKYDGKLVLPRGRVKIGEEGHFDTGIRTLRELLGMTIESPNLFSINDQVFKETTRPSMDFGFKDKEFKEIQGRPMIKEISAEKLAQGGLVPDELSQTVFEGHYTFDVAIHGISFGEPKPSRAEVLEAKWYNLDELDIDEFYGSHRILVRKFNHFLRTRSKPTLGEL